MPLLVDPVLPAGSLRRLRQPRLSVDSDLVLRPWCAGDAPAVREAFADPDIQRWHVRRMDSDDEACGWIAAWAGRWADERDASWAIARGTDDRAVGQVGLRALRLAEAQAELSYWVAPAGRGARAAARSTRVLARWAFGTLRLNRLFLVHSTANER